MNQKQDFSKSKTNFLYSIFSIFIVYSFIFPQITNATIFQPGETLTPDCAPESIDCGVAIFSLNDQINTTQTLVTGISGVDFNIISDTDIHTFNIPSASSLARGLLTALDFTTFNNKQDLLVSGTNIKTIGGSSILGSGDIALSGSGTVTSVGLSLPSIFSVSNSPITTSGTLSASLESQNANTVFASPDGVSGSPVFRSLVATDLPTGIPNANLANSSISFSTGTSGSDFNISGSPVSLGGILTLNIPTASASNRGLLSTADWSSFDGKQSALGFTPLDPANNLSDLVSAGTARTNLGLGTLSTQSGTFSGTSSGTNTGDQTTITGNAGTATALQTARTIGGVSFDGTANITVASATGGFTVSGGDLALGANNITMSGSLGTTGTRLTKGWFTDLEATNAIVGSITGNAATVTTNANLTGAVTSVGNATSLGSFTSANLLSAVTDETGSGLSVFNNSPTFVDDITIGGAGVATGQIKLNGTTSGTVILQTADAAGTYTLTLPTNDGTASQFLQTNGSGVTSWATISGGDGGSGSIQTAEYVQRTQGANISVAPGDAIEYTLDVPNVYDTIGISTAAGPGAIGTAFNLPIGEYMVDFENSSDGAWSQAVYQGGSNTILAINNDTIAGASTATTWIHGRARISVTGAGVDDWIMISPVTGTNAIPTAGTAAGEFIARLTIIKLDSVAMNASLDSGHLFVGNASGISTDVPASGDISLINTGAFTVQGIANKTLDTSAFTPNDGDAIIYDSILGKYKAASVSAGGDALTSDPLSQFASTTSLQLAGVISDETGSGALVFANSPTLVTPALGAATYTTLSGGNITDSALTAGRVTFAGTAGLLVDDADLTFATDTLSATKLLSSTSVSTPSLISTGALTITPAAGSNLNLSLSTTGDFAVNTDQFYVDTSAARVGIGTATPSYKLSIADTLASGNIASISNFDTSSSATKSVLRLNIGTATGTNLTRFMQFYAGVTTEAGAGTGVGNIRLNNAGITYASGNADLAEWTDVTDSPVAGDIISALATGNQKAVTGELVLGVVTDTAAFIGNETADLTGQVVVGMLGRVNTKVSNENGDIAIGDPITASSVAGVGMKQTKAGPTIGKALAAKTGATVERIAVQVVPGWYDPDPLLTPASFTISGSDVLDFNSDAVTRVGGFEHIFGADIEIANGLTIGTNGGTTGTIDLKGTTGGTVTLKTADAAGTYTLTLPTDDGTASQFLQTDGSGVTSWASIPGGGDALTSDPLSQFASTTSLQLAGVISDETGSGALVFANSPTLVTPALGTPSSVTLTNATGLPITGITSSTSAELATLLSDETGTGKVVFDTSPEFLTSITTGSTSFNLLNTTATTLNIGGTATTLALGASTSTTTLGGKLVVGSSTDNGIDFVESDTNPSCAAGDYKIFADASETKFKKCTNGVVTDLDTGGGGGAGSDLQMSKTQLTNSTLTGTTSATAVNLGTVSITPTTATGDVYVYADIFTGSLSNTDQTLTWEIRSGSACNAGSLLSSSTSDLVGSNGQQGANGYVTYLAVDAGASAQTYVVCAYTSSASGSSAGGVAVAMVIDTGADYAEIYTSNDTSLEAGDVVSLDSNLKTGVRKSENSYDKNVIGIISTRPGILIGRVEEEGQGAFMVALSGRVPVKVNTENGAIVSGDYLTSSSTPGVAMKSKGSGPVIGQAMSAYSGDDIGIITVFVKNFNLGQSNMLLGDIFPQVNADEIENIISTLISDIKNEIVRNPIEIISQKIIDGVQFLTDLVVARITAIRGYFDEIFTKKIHTEVLCIKKSDGNEVCMTGDQIENILGNVESSDDNYEEESVVEEEVVEEEEEVVVEEEESVVEEEVIEEEVVVEEESVVEEEVVEEVVEEEVVEEEVIEEEVIEEEVVEEEVVEDPII